MDQQQQFRLSYEFLPAGRKPLILLPLDGTIQAKSALPFAKLVGRILGATIHVVHATDKPLALHELTNHLKLSKEEVHGLIFEQVSGDPAQVITRHAAEKKATLIIMSLRGHDTPPEVAPGPVVRQVIQNAPCPVMLVRPEIASKVEMMSGIRRILLPLDGAPSTAAVIGPAHKLAHHSNAGLDFLHILEPGGKRPQETGTLTYPHYVDQPQHEWPAWAQEFLSRFSNRPPGTSHPAHESRIFLKIGKPVEEILFFAGEHDVDLIVLEWLGQLDLEHALVMQGILKGSPCPVLLLRVQTD